MFRLNLSRSLLIVTMSLFTAALAGCNTTGTSDPLPPKMCCTDCAGEGCCQESCCDKPGCADCSACPECMAMSSGAKLEAAPDGADIAVITAGGMGCPLCASSAEKQLERIDGVKDIVIDLGTGELLVTVDPASRPSAEQLARAVTDGGFTVESVSWRKGSVK